MRLIDADRLLTERMKSKYYHLPNGDTAIPLIDIEHAPTVGTGSWIPITDALPQANEETPKRATRFERIKNTLTIEEMAQLLCKLSTCSLCVASGHCHNNHPGYIDWLKEEAEGSEE